MKVNFGMVNGFGHRRHGVAVKCCKQRSKLNGLIVTAEALNLFIASRVRYWAKVVSRFVAARGVNVKGWLQGARGKMHSLPDCIVLGQVDVLENAVSRS